MKYRNFLSLTDDEIIFAMKDIFRCTEIYRILRCKKDNEIHVETKIPLQDEIIRETVILKGNDLQAPWIDSWEEEKRWEQFLLAKGCHSLLKNNPYLEQLYYLVSSNGYDIKYASYCSKEAAVGAMKQAYKEAIPEEWDEDCEEMSYLADEDAILLINGIAILVWKIIPQSDFQFRKVPLPVKKKEILVDEETATQIENDLHSDDIKGFGESMTPRAPTAILRTLAMGLRWTSDSAAVISMMQSLEIPSGPKRYCLRMGFRFLAPIRNSIFSVNGNLNIWELVTVWKLKQNKSNKKRDFIPLFSYFCLIHSLPHYCFTVLLSKKKMDGITILFLQTEQR